MVNKFELLLKIGYEVHAQLACALEALPERFVSISHMEFVGHVSHAQELLRVLIAGLEDCQAPGDEHEHAEDDMILLEDNE